MLTIRVDRVLLLGDLWDIHVSSSLSLLLCYIIIISSCNALFMKYPSGTRQVPDRYPTGALFPLLYYRKVPRQYPDRYPTVPRQVPDFPIELLWRVPRQVPLQVSDIIPTGTRQG